MSWRWLVLGLICFGTATAAIILWIQREPSSAPIGTETLARRTAEQMDDFRNPARIPELLRDSSWKVRLAAANALRELETISPAQRATLVVETLEREVLAPAKGPPRMGSFVPLSTSLRLQYLGLLEELGPRGADAVRKARAPATSEAREWRVLAMGAVEAREAAPQLRELLTNSRDPAVRMTAAHHLGWLKDSAAIPALRQALNDPATARSVGDRPGLARRPFYPVRSKAARALRELGFMVEQQGNNFMVR